MNEYDSDLLAQNLICSGFFPVDYPERADLILINTCTVRAKPEQKAFSLLGRLTASQETKARFDSGGCRLPGTTVWYGRDEEVSSDRHGYRAQRDRWDSRFS